MLSTVVGLTERAVAALERIAAALEVHAPAGDVGWKVKGVDLIDPATAPSVNSEEYVNGRS